MPPTPQTTPTTTPTTANATTGTNTGGSGKTNTTQTPATTATTTNTGKTTATSRNPFPTDGPSASKEAQAKAEAEAAIYRNPSLGFILAVLAGLLFASSTMIIKHINNAYNAVSLSLFRYAGAVLIVFPLLLENGQPIQGPSTWSARVWVFLRGVFAALSFILHCSAVPLISVFNSTIISTGAPILVFIFARFFFKEPCGRIHMISMVVAVIGVFFLTDVFSTLWIKAPGNETDSTSKISLKPEEANTIAGINTRTLGNILEICQTIVVAFSYVFIRKLSNEHPILVLFDHSLVAALLLFCLNFSPLGDLLIFNKEKSKNATLLDMNSTETVSISSSTPKSPFMPYYMILLCLFTFYGNSLNIKARQLVDPLFVTTLGTFSEIMFAFVGDLIFFDESPSFVLLLGSALLLIALAIVLFRNYLLTKPVDFKLRKYFKFLED